MKFLHSQTKLRITTVGMYYDDWIVIFTGLVDPSERIAAKIFLESKMVEVEEGKRPVSLDYAEFLETLVRIAEWQSLPPQFDNNPERVHPSRYPLCFKLENLLVWLLKKNPDLSNKLVKKVLERRGLF